LVENNNNKKKQTKRCVAPVFKHYTFSNMSTAAKVTLGTSILFCCASVYGVHYSQNVEKEVLKKKENKCIHKRHVNKPLAQLRLLLFIELENGCFT
jgi:hypothetical protein